VWRIEIETDKSQRMATVNYDEKQQGRVCAMQIIERTKAKGE